MKIPTLPFTVTDWSQVAATKHPGETGEALWRTLNIGDLRVRMVEYSPGYLADHWCDRGHVLYVLEGELDSELRDGRKFKLKAGMSYQVSDFGDDGSEAVYRGLSAAPAAGSPRPPLRHLPETLRQSAQRLGRYTRLFSTHNCNCHFSTWWPP